MINEQAEAERLYALQMLELLDSAPEREYTELVELAAEMCAVPISTISLIDHDRQWFKAAVGLAQQETSREASICTHTIEQTGLMEIEDLQLDQRFCGSPLVTGEINAMRFYAGIPLMSGDQPVGTLCVVDTVPRTLSEAQRRGLRILARQVQSRMELHSKQKMLARISDEKQKLSRSLEIRTAMFTAFMDNGPFVSYIKDADGRFLFYNAKMRDVFRVEGDAWLGLSDQDLFPREMAAKFREHDHQVLRSGLPVAIEEQSPGPDDTTLTWRSYKFPIVDETNAVMLAGISIEITAEIERKAELERLLRESQELSHSLAQSHAMLRTLLENNPNQCYLKSEDGRYLFYNRKFAEHFGIDHKKWLGRTDYDLVPRALADRLREHDLLALGSDGVVESVGVLAGDHEAACTTFKVLKFRCRDEEGRPMLAAMALDISDELERHAELQRTCIQLEALASLDGLTGVLNRRSFDQRIAEEFSRADLLGRPLSLLLLDIDNFKRRNDRYGHAAGDEVLRRLAGALESCCRKGDVAARVGGEEFALLLPSTDAAAASQVADRLLAAVRVLGPFPEPVTVSIGVASVNPTTRNAERLYGRADDAMYTAKRLGKDRVVVHSDHLNAMLRDVAQNLERDRVEVISA